MFKKHWKVYLGFIVLTEAVGALSALITRDGMEIYNAQVVKPALSPPPIVFPIVWVILYALIGWGAALVWLNCRGRDRTIAMTLYTVQLVFNFFWSIIFFNLREYLGALIWIAILWVLILLMIIYFKRVSRTAAALQIPYIIWVGFATYLNAAVWLLNR